MQAVGVFFLAVSAAAAAGPDLDALISSAMTAPGEFGADALLRLASLETLPNARRVELLEQAFERAAAAQQPYKRLGALVRNEGSVQLLNKVHGQNLDALGLRLRAVEMLQPLDAEKSRSLFARIPEIRLPRLTCEDFLVYDLSRFYSVLEKVSASEAGQTERSRLLSRYARTITSPVQVAGMARVLAAADVDDAGFQTLLRDFISALATIKGDDRSFTWSRGVGRQMEALSAEAQKRGISPLPLLESYRVYLVWNLSGPRCADSDLMQGGNSQSFALRTPEDSDPQAAEFASYFNQRLRMAPLQTIQELEVMPAKVDGFAKGLRSCEDPECQGFLERYRNLFKLERNSTVWNQEVGAAVAALGEWGASAHGGPAQFFLEKAAGYSTLLNLAANETARALVMKSLIGFIEGSPVQQSDRAAWLLAVSALTGRITVDPAGFAPYAEELLKSRNPVIALYAGLEAVAPRPPDRILPLL